MHGPENLPSGCAVDKDMDGFSMRILDILLIRIPDILLMRIPNNLPNFFNKPAVAC